MGIGPEQGQFAEKRPTKVIQLGLSQREYDFVRTQAELHHHPMSEIVRSAIIALRNLIAAQRTIDPNLRITSDPNAQDQGISAREFIEVLNPLFPESTPSRIPKNDASSE